MSWRIELMIGLMLSVSLSAVTRADEDAKPTTMKAPAADAWREAVEAALSQKHSFDFREVPLREAVASLQQQAAISIRLVDRALVDAGVDSDTPVTLKVKDLPLRSVLRRLFFNLRDLTYVVADGGLLLTTRERAEGLLHTAVFGVRDLVAKDETQPNTPSDHSSLVDLIQSSLNPSTWADTQSGPGTIKFVDGRLVVSQTHENLDQLQYLLRALREAKRLIAESAGRAPTAVSIDVVAADSTRAELRRALDRVVRLNIQQTPLQEVLDRLGQETETSLLIEPHALEDA